jgi:hypothetical protein
MRSRAALFNMALNWCRAGEIADPDAPGPLPDACRRFYPSARDAVLQAYPWNEAAERAALAALPPPPFEWSAAYRLPDDCLALRDLYDDPAALHAVEGRNVLCNLSAPLRIRYTKRIEAEDMRPLLFVAVAARLAADMAPSLMESATGAAALEAKAKDALMEAKRADAKEGNPPQPAESYDWLSARHGGAF